MGLLGIQFKEGADNANSAGDVVYVRAGTYTEDLTWLSNSGCDPDYITFENYNSESVTVKAATTAWCRFRIEGVHWIKIKGITFDCDAKSQMGFCILGDTGTGTSEIWLDEVVITNSEEFGCLSVNDVVEDIEKEIEEKDLTWLWIVVGLIVVLVIAVGVRYKKK